jgi:Flp pilus assembly pilin Flp
VRRIHSTLLAVRFRFDQHIADRGANLVEYLLLVAFLAILVMVSVQLFGKIVGTKYSTVANSLP